MKTGTNEPYGSHIWLLARSCIGDLFASGPIPLSVNAFSQSSFNPIVIAKIDFRKAEDQIQLPAREIVSLSSMKWRRGAGRGGARGLKGQASDAYPQIYFGNYSISRKARHSNDTNGVEQYSPGLAESSRPTPGFNPIESVTFARSAASEASISVGGSNQNKPSHAFRAQKNKPKQSKTHQNKVKQTTGAAPWSRAVKCPPQKKFAL